MILFIEARVVLYLTLKIGTIPVLRRSSVNMASPFLIAWRTFFNSNLFTFNCYGSGRIRIQTKYSSHDFCTTGAHKTCKANDFTGMYVKINIVENTRLWKIFNFFTILPWKTLLPQDIVALFCPCHNGRAGAFLMYYKLHYRNMDAQRFLWYTNMVSAALLKTLTEWMFYGFF